MSRLLRGYNLTCGRRVDVAKDRSNRRKHGVSLAAAEHFDFENATHEIDDREDYGEPRFRATGFVGVTLHSLVDTVRGTVIRVISLRQANAEERRVYAENN